MLKRPPTTASRSFVGAKGFARALGPFIKCGWRSGRQDSNTDLGNEGAPESVADQLLAFQDQTGAFGTLLYAGKDWKDRELGRRSMILMAEKVLPRVNGGSPSHATAEK